MKANPKTRRALRMIRSAALAVLAGVLLPSCLILDGSFDDRELISFAFTKEANPALRLERSAKFEGNHIRIDIPDYMDATKLVAEFEFTGIEVRVGGKLQTSGVTANDFSRPVVYEVLGKDEKTTAYRVEATIVPPNSDTAIKAMAFGFLVEQEPDSDIYWFNRCGSYSGDWSGPEITVPITLWNVTTNALRRTYFAFDTAAMSIVAQGKTLRSEADADLSIISYYSENNYLDLSGTVTLTATAEDGSVDEYAFTVDKTTSLVHFRFEPMNNIGLAKAAAGTVDRTAGTIRVELPSNLDRSKLVASFDANYYTGVRSVTVAGAVQQSDVTANDFSGPIDYVVTSVLGAETTFRVLVAPVAPGVDKVLQNIRIGSIHLNQNGSFWWEYYSSSLVYEFPYHWAVNLAALYVAPEIIGVRISVKEGNNPERSLVRSPGTDQAYPQNFVDFSGPVVFIVTAEDGSTKEYATRITKAR